jgi:hypothetical protein
MSEKRKAKLKQEVEAGLSLKEMYNTNVPDVSILITKCDDLIAEAATLYLSNSNKELNDAIIILHSAKRSLHKISLN